MIHKAVCHIRVQYMHVIHITTDRKKYTDHMYNLHNFSLITNHFDHKVIRTADVYTLMVKMQITKTAM